MCVCVGGGGGGGAGAGREAPFSGFIFLDILDISYTFQNFSNRKFEKGGGIPSHKYNTNLIGLHCCHSLFTIRKVCPFSFSNGTRP